MLFILVFIFLTLVSSTEEGHICRPPFRHGSPFLYLFLQITFLARCYHPSGLRVTSLVPIRNQPRFLKLQKEWDRKGGGRKCGKKGGCRRSEAEKVAEKKVAAAEIVGKANPEKKRRRKREESLS